MTFLPDTLDQILRLDASSLDGLSLTAIFLIIVVTTFATEDGACLAAGALAGQGRITFTFAVTACFAGIVIGDVGLYFFGRIFGNSISKTRLFKRFVSEASLTNASDWLEKRGVAAIFISRFVAGLRLPTYVAAGFLKTNFLKFLFYFIIAAIIWTPLIVGSATFAQKFISPQYLFLSIVILYFVLHLLFNLVTWKRRRLLVGKLGRIRHWEFWPIWIFYFPVLIYVFFLAIKHRSLTVFTCSNPAIIGGGFIGESKHDIYKGLQAETDENDFLLSHHLLPEEMPLDNRLRSVAAWQDNNGLDFPVVVKPDSGERGKQVEIAHDLPELTEMLNDFEGDLLIQEFADGVEISVFYYRYPSQQNGKIFSITEKVFPELTGNGKNNLEELILMDKRAVCLADKYFDQNIARLHDVPSKGEKIQIIDIGTHSRGAIFNEGKEIQTEELERAIDSIVKQYDGFYFGLFDLKAPTREDFRRAESVKIIELNGVTSESTNIYDKRYSLFDAYGILFNQWRIAFEIGAENVARGFQKTRLRDLIRLFFGFEVTP
jgi:membrane protein DedA with SNARE-associated domain